MKDDKTISRRDFIQRISFIGVAGIGAGSLISACGGGETGGDTGTQGTETPAAGAEFSCTDTSGLTEAELQTRQTLAYVDRSTIPEKLCDNCQFYQAAAEGQCGTCTLVKGPIHPDGYCNSWVAKMQTAT